MRRLIIILQLLFWFGCDDKKEIDDENIPQDIEDFVAQENLPDLNAIKLWFELIEPELILFSASYGPPMDCESGCFYATVYGIKTNRQIGWALSENGTTSIISKSNIYPIDEFEITLFDTTVLSEIKNTENLLHWYWSILFKLLAEDVDTPSETLIYLALSLYDYIAPYLTGTLLSNPKISSEIEVLCAMYNNPIYVQQWYYSAIIDSLGNNVSNCN